MKLSAIVLARALGFVDILDLSPRGRVFLPELVPEIVKKFNFQKYPASADDLDETKGIEFLDGKFNDKVVLKFVIWNTLLVVETRSGTHDSKTILEAMLQWGADNFGLAYKPGSITRFGYVSDVSFYSDIPLLDISPALSSLALKTGEALSDIWQESVAYEPLNLIVGHDPTARKYGIAPFSITRRAESRFSENKYFSEAPLPTEVHLKFLEEFERDVRESQKSRNMRFPRE